MLLCATGPQSKYILFAFFTQQVIECQAANLAQSLWITENSFSEKTIQHEA